MAEALPPEIEFMLRTEGRPALPAGEGKRYPLSLRTTKALRDDIVAAASRSGRSIAGEVELRLEISFVEERMRERAGLGVVASPAATGMCEFCDAPFARGRGTMRRADAIFCCDDHRVRFHSLRQSARTRRAVDELRDDPALAKLPRLRKRGTDQR